MSDNGLEVDQVFCYGTLLPGQERWEFLAPFVVAHEPDQIAGRLYDTGLGYPAAFFDRVGVIHGVRFRLDPARLSEALSLLDEIEGAVEGLYHRVAVVTATGVQVYAYQYGGEGVGLTNLPDGNWLAR
jgi:gamma-glutamylcyclotransferase (GGCT)/AIG2-like uncharacterized protein YtfP